MESALVKRLSTHIGASAIAFFLGLSIGPFWKGDVSYRFGAGGYFEETSFWRALSMVARNAPSQGIGGAFVVFIRENAQQTAVFLGLCLGFCAVYTLFMYAIRGLVKTTAAERMIALFVVGFAGLAG